jgi:hypothetical protein
LYNLTVLHKCKYGTGTTPYLHCRPWTGGTVRARCRALASLTLRESSPCPRGSLQTPNREEVNSLTEFYNGFNRLRRNFVKKFVSFPEIFQNFVHPFPFIFKYHTVPVPVRYRMVGNGTGMTLTKIRKLFLTKCVNSFLLHIFQHVCEKVIGMTSQLSHDRVLKTSVSIQYR